MCLLLWQAADETASTFNNTISRHIYSHKDWSYRHWSMSEFMYEHIQYSDTLSYLRYLAYINTPGCSHCHVLDKKQINTLHWLKFKSEKCRTSYMSNWTLMCATHVMGQSWMCTKSHHPNHRNSVTWSASVICRLQYFTLLWFLNACLVSSPLEPAHKNHWDKIIFINKDQVGTHRILKRQIWSHCWQ